MSRFNIDMAMRPNILALESSGTSASVALLQGDETITQSLVPEGKRTAAELAPLVQSQLKAAGWSAADLQLIAVTRGPGSFTGLRVGVTTAKTLAYVVDCHVVGIDTLEVIAHQVPSELQQFWIIMNAQRQQLFAARFGRDEAGNPVYVSPVAIVDCQAWLAQLDSNIHVSGPVLEKIRQRIPANVPLVAEDLWYPTAPSVGRLALQQYESGTQDNLWTLSPAYYRRSAAEEKWEENHGG